MIGSKALSEMVAAGLTSAQILSIVQAMEEEAAGRASNDDELARRRAVDRERKRAARAAVRGQSEDKSKDVSEETPLSLSPNENNSNPHTHTPEKNTPRARKGWPVPVGVSAEQWVAFCCQRKKPLNEHAYGLLTGKLETLARDGWPPGEMIDRAIEHGWETVFAPKDHRNGRPRQLPANDGQGRGARTLALLAADDPPEASTGFS